MNITHDLIAAVSGPGWRYGLSRILIDDAGRGVVFIAGAETPFARFSVTSLSTSRGEGSSPEGQIVWSRRGSSCQYKLAKCKVSTDTLISWWSASESVPEPIAPEASPEVPSGTIGEILDWVGRDPARAAQAKTAELAGKNRSTLLASLAEIVDDIL